MDLEECLLITDTTLIHLAMGCPRLEKLVRRFIKDRTIEGLFLLAKDELMKFVNLCRSKIESVPL